jgi:hypothetical protein
MASWVLEASHATICSVVPGSTWYPVINETITAISDVISAGIATHAGQILGTYWLSIHTRIVMILPAITPHVIFRVGVFEFIRGTVRPPRGSSD